MVQVRDMLEEKDAFGAARGVLTPVFGENLPFAMTEPFRSAIYKILLTKKHSAEMHPHR